VSGGRLEPNLNLGRIERLRGEGGKERGRGVIRRNQSEASQERKFAKIILFRRTGGFCGVFENLLQKSRKMSKTHTRKGCTCIFDLIFRKYAGNGNLDKKCVPLSSGTFSYKVRNADFS
jgi:hypothetical protein